MKELLPRIYEGVLETDVIMDCEDNLFKEFDSEYQKLLNDQHIDTLSISGIEDFERRLSIIPDTATESLDFRRERIKNRLTTIPPFTISFLYAKLNNIIGVGKWEGYIDYPNYTLYIESSAENQQWFMETLITINSIKPANIVFINKPFVANDIEATEQISADELKYNYKLGTSWVLGAKPFISLSDMGVIKMANISSIKEDFLEGIANSGLDLITAVKLNGTYTISDITKSVEDNILTISYSIPTDSGLSEIAKVDLLGADNSVLSSANVYVPIVSDTMFKHTFIFKEG
jgi:hypothetical protein